MSRSLTVSGAELTLIGRARYPNAYVRALDEDYNVPTEDSIQVFNKELAKHLFALYGDRWQEFFDCDNFSLEAVTLACRKHFIARYAGKGNAQGVAIGLICFSVVPGNPLSGHCICTRLTGRKTLVEFEPQNRMFYPLTNDQCKSASLCLFF